MQNFENAIQAQAARKMAIVDAMTPAQRAIVWEIGLNNFSRTHVKAYAKAKAKAGVQGRCKFTQSKVAAKGLAA